MNDGILFQTIVEIVAYCAGMIMFAPSIIDDKYTFYSDETGELYFVVSSQGARKSCIIFVHAS